MIHILGRRRIMTLGILAGICLLLSGFYLVVLFPQVSAADRTLRGIRGDVSGMEEKSRSLRSAFEEFRANKPDYDRIEQVGFFNPQDRLLIRERFQAMKKQTGVLSARYDIEPAQVIANPQVEDAGYRMLQSRMDIALDAVDDRQVYAFMYALGNEFPGRISMVEVNITRADAGLTDANVAEIASANPPVLIKAIIKADWYSLVSAKEIEGLIEGVAPAEGGPQ